MATPYTVVIDIGHGIDTFPPSKGIQRGGRYYEEHNFNAKVAIELESLLQMNGFQVLMYQKPFAKEIGLNERTNYYARIQPDLVWSIHANFNSNPRANGRCAFYWFEDENAEQLATIYADEVRNAGYSTHGTGTHESRYNSWTNLHICRENYKNGITAVLTENGFMTGNADFELVFGDQQEQYVKDIAEIHAKSICRYFNVEFQTGGLTMDQYNELKQEIEALRRENAELRRIITNPTPQASDWAEEHWKEAVDKGYFDGSRPQALITRQEVATVANRLDEKIENQ